MCVVQLLVTYNNDRNRPLERCAHPLTQVTLVHSKPQLLHILKSKAQRCAHKFLVDRGVQVILGDKVDTADGSVGTVPPASNLERAGSRRPAGRKTWGL